MEQKPISDSFEQGSPYERYVGRWSRSLAPKFLSWMDCPGGLRWLDVGCGTGALSAAVLNACSPSLVVGAEPSRGFIKTAQMNLAGRASLCQAVAQALPMRSGCFDVVVSGLALNFVPDPRAGLMEMFRVTKDGGSVGAYVWDYGGKMEMLQAFWEAAIELDPAASRLDEAPRFPVCRPGPLDDLFTSSGLSDVHVEGIELQMRFVDFDDYWGPFLGGQGPAPAYAMSLDDAARARLRERLRARLPVEPDGSIPLIARAWAVRGDVLKSDSR